MSWLWKSVELIKNKIFRARQGDAASPPLKREVSALPLKWKQNHHLKLYHLPGDKTHTYRRAFHMSKQLFTLFWFRPILEGHAPILSLPVPGQLYLRIHLGSSIGLWPGLLYYYDNYACLQFSDPSFRPVAKNHINISKFSHIL